MSTEDSKTVYGPSGTLYHENDTGYAAHLYYMKNKEKTKDDLNHMPSPWKWYRVGGGSDNPIYKLCYSPVLLETTTETTKITEIQEETRETLLKK